MAFTFCENCGEKIDIADTKCPYCGYVRGSNNDDREPSRDRRDRDERNGSDSYDSYDSRRQYDDGDQLWRTPREGEQGQYIPPYRRPEPNPYTRQYAPPRPRARRPVSVGMIVYSAINMFFGLFFIVGLIFGSLALAQTISAQRARTDDEETAKKKTALILNIIGTVLTVINIVAIVVGFVTAADALAALTVFLPR